MKLQKLQLIEPSRRRSKYTNMNELAMPEDQYYKSDFKDWRLYHLSSAGSIREYCRRLGGNVGKILKFKTPN